MNATKEQLIEALAKFIAQRSGIEFGNYQSGDWKASREAFNGDYRPILRYGRHARAMLQAVRLRDSITAENLIAATRAYSGRLQFKENGEGVHVEYTTGQYFPTEYRAAACAVLSAALWDYWSNDIPAWQGKETHQAGIVNMAEAIRKQARNEFGRAIASTWFN